MRFSLSRGVASKVMKTLSRMFVAIIPPKDVLQELIAQQEAIKKFTKIKEGYTLAEKIHLTLKFIGFVHAAEIPDLIKALKAIAAPSFTVFLKNFGKFPKGGPYNRVVWIGAKSDDLVTLAHVINAALLKRVVHSENAFHPHFTLLRPKSITKSQAQLLNEFLTNAPVKELSFQVNEFYLYCSKPMEGSSLH
jgi:2'-5' RNA ligase